MKNYPRITELTHNTLALILAGGEGNRLKELTQWRAKPAVPFGGKYRIIDFALSNCVNSDIRHIGILTQYKSHSLIRHVQRAWNFMRYEVGEFVELLPAQQRVGNQWYLGTANALYQNLDIIRQHKPCYVLVLGGDHIYAMDYRDMIETHAFQSAYHPFYRKAGRSRSDAGKAGLCVGLNGDLYFFSRFPVR